MQLPNINKKRIISLLKNEERLDGRELHDYRILKIQGNVSNKAEGSARVWIGKTDVIVGVKLDVQEPYPDHDDEGTLIVSMEFSATAGERHESGPPQIDAIEIARIVDRGIRESGFIDWKKLCIKKGEKVWAINIDIYCLNDDGNVLDASAIGAITALKLSKMAVYDKKEEKVKFGELSNDNIPLTANIPFTTTYYKIGEKFIVDPNRDEEDAAEARLTIAISSFKKEKIIHAMQKGGEIPITENEIKEIIDKVDKNYDKIFSDIKIMINELEKI